MAEFLAIELSLCVPSFASGDLQMHARGRGALQDSMTAIRHDTTVGEAGLLLFAIGELHLLPLNSIAEHYADWMLA
ncbi:hypothetical protein, partial [Pseudomonas syringae group genomosp. 7]|uniref:hypothetical protein n=1 Tax=Pseudomonas syringae group genomosp. 7 TaxID=251699 RepID=UPI00376FBE0D